MAEVEMVIDSLRVSLEDYKHVLILKEKEGKRSLPIFVGSWEAEAIAVKLQNVPAPRPTAHDLLCKVVGALGFTVKSVTLDRLQEETYYAELALTSHDKSCQLDCRPSDAVAVAIRVGAPIFADEKVMDEAGMMLDPDIGEPAEIETTYDEEVGYEGLNQVKTRELVRLSGSVRELFALAEEQAKRLNSKYIGAGHLLLALVKKAPNTATDILNGLGVNLTELLSAVKSSSDEEYPPELCKLALSESAKRTIQLSVEEAKNFDSQQVLPEHLLIGMLREDKGAAGKILRGLGITIDKTYTELIRCYNRATATQPSQLNLRNQESAFLGIEGLRPHECPYCKKETLFWNSSNRFFQCYNRKCKRRLTMEEFRSGVYP